MVYMLKFWYLSENITIHLQAHSKNICLKIFFLDIFFQRGYTYSVKYSKKNLKFYKFNFVQNIRRQQNYIFNTLGTPFISLKIKSIENLDKFSYIFFY